MTDKTTTVAFSLDGNGSWKGGGAGLCNSGVREVLDLPENCEKFFAVFTSKKPAGDDYFDLTPDGVGFTTLDHGVLGQMFLGEATYLMDRKRKAGYRYLRVEMKVKTLADRVLHFKRPNNWGQWLAGSIGLCSEGLQEAVTLPRGCTAFDAVFSEDKPKGSGIFEITVNGIVGQGGQQFYDYARDEIRRVYNAGYRWLQVEA